MRSSGNVHMVFCGCKKILKKAQGCTVVPVHQSVFVIPINLRGEQLNKAKQAIQQSENNNLGCSTLL